jgi:BirA family biotin operon repressor/biotin-[acetyl-CoA-carboxylase] ligase
MGKNFVFVPECHSTNDIAHKLCLQPGATEGTLVITHNQTKGRGQRGNRWESEPGRNLTFSLILKPSFLSVGDQFYLNIIASLAIADYLRAKSAHDIRIKWPNDVIAAGRKISGILIENQISGSSFSHVIMGIGLNINQRGFDVDTATSLALITGKEHDLQDELEALLEMLEARYLQLRQLDLTLLREEYLRNMYWLGEVHTFAAASDVFEGIIEGIDGSGKLVIKHNGRSRAFSLKEVSFVR